MSLLRDASLLAAGTLTAVRVPPPSRVDRSVAGVAMVLAPPAVLPLAAAAALVVLVAGWIDLPPLATAYVVLLVLALVVSYSPAAMSPAWRESHGAAWLGSILGELTPFVAPANAESGAGRV